MKNRVALFIRWNTNPKELRELAKMLERSNNLSLTIKTENMIDVIIMLMEDDKE